MNSTTLTRSEQQTGVLQRSHPLMSVMVWELRRFCASRLFWIQALGFFCFVFFVTWVQKTPAEFGRAMNGQEDMSGFIAGTSAWGLFQTLPSSTLLLLVLLLPFITADGVTRDVQRRTHELLMTTSLPTWAYVWGRYLVGLFISLGLAVILMVAILAMGLVLHLTIPAYPLPSLRVVFILWLGMVVPATVLVSSFSFALSTLFPLMSTLVKIIILTAWVIGVVMIPNGFSSTLPPTWYNNWDPTSAVTALGMLSSYTLDFKDVTSIAQFQQVILTTENGLPDISGWFVPHLLLAGFSLVLVLVAALCFKRTREVLA